MKELVTQVAPPLVGGAIPTPPLHFSELDKTTATTMIIEHHYAHRKAPISWAWAIKQGTKNVGVLTVGKPQTYSTQASLVGEKFTREPTPQNRFVDVYELNRLWLSDELPKGTESRFLGWCLRELRKIRPSTILVSYADTAHGHIGIVYQATNWLYTGCSLAFKDICVEGYEDYRSVHHKLRGGYVYKCSLHGAFPTEYPIELTEVQHSLLRNFSPPTRLCPQCGAESKRLNRRSWSIMKEVQDPKTGKYLPITRKTRSTKHRYVWFCNPNDKKILAWEILPYPKKEPIGN